MAATEILFLYFMPKILIYLQYQCSRWGKLLISQFSEGKWWAGDSDRRNGLSRTVHSLLEPTPSKNAAKIITFSVLGITKNLAKKIDAKVVKIAVKFEILEPRKDLTEKWKAGKWFGKRVLISLSKFFWIEEEFFFVLREGELEIFFLPYAVSFLIKLRGFSWQTKSAAVIKIKRKISRIPGIISINSSTYVSGNSDSSGGFIVGLSRMYHKKNPK